MSEGGIIRYEILEGGRLHAFKPTFPETITVKAAVAIEIHRALRMLRDVNLNDDMPATIRVYGGNDEYWDLNYPKDEWFCSMIRAVGYEA